MPTLRFIDSTHPSAIVLEFEPKESAMQERHESTDRYKQRNIHYALSQIRSTWHPKLLKIASAGNLIVGYSESSAFMANFEGKRLDKDCFIYYELGLIASVSGEIMSPGKIWEELLNE